MVLTESELVDHGDAGKTYNFRWNEKINTVISPNAVVVVINSDGGNVISYINSDSPLNVDITPSITKEDAIVKATTVFSPIENVSSDAHLFIYPKNENEQKLMWDVEITGQLHNNVERGGYVYIDAHSGNIVEVGHFN